jgi:hypothetical protein
MSWKSEKRKTGSRMGILSRRCEVRYFSLVRLTEEEVRKRMKELNQRIINRRKKGAMPITMSKNEESRTKENPYRTLNKSRKTTQK